jgi:hypothetical protein
MAGIKIVDLPALGRDLLSTDLLEMSIGGTASRKITGQEIMNASKLNVGSTPIVSGTVGRVLFQGTGNVLQQSSSLFWDSTNNRLGIGTSTPSQTLDVNGNIAVNNSVYVFSAAYSSYTRALYDDGSLSTVVRGNTHLDFWTANNFRMRVNNSGNVLINTTTDAGFRLDVNGTARVQGQLTTTTANAQFGAIGASTGEFRIDGVNGAAYAFSVYSSSTLRFGVTGFGGITAPGGLIISATSDLNTTRLRLGTSSSTAPINIQAQSGNADTIVLKASNGVDQFIIKNATGNVLINTTTDAGFRLDVNGTARVQNTLRVVGSVGYGSNVFEFGVNGGSSANGYIDGFGRWFISNGGTNTTAATIGSNILFLGQSSSSAAIAFSNASNIIGQWSGTAGVLTNTTTSESIILVNNQNTQNLYGITIAGDQTAGQVTSKNLLTLSHWGSSGVYTFNNLVSAQTYTLINVNISVSPTQSNKILRGFYYNPTITGVALSENYAFHGTSGAVIINSTSPNASAVLQSDSTTQGFLPPRMTNAQRTAIVSPAVGLIVYCTDVTEGLWVYKSTGWTFIV